MSKSVKTVALSLFAAASALSMSTGAIAGPEKKDKADAAATAKPASEVPAPTIDSNGDGKADAWDRNGDGKADAWDQNGDGKPDAVDNDGDGAPDA